MTRKASWTVIAIAVVAICFAPVLSHHNAEGIVDEEVYEMIDALVADTPHASLTFDDMGNLILATRTVTQLESMIDDGLMTYIAMLDGDVTLTVRFEPRGGATATVTQTR